MLIEDRCHLEAELIVSEQASRQRQRIPVGVGRRRTSRGRLRCPLCPAGDLGIGRELALQGGEDLARLLVETSQLQVFGLEQRTLDVDGIGLDECGIHRCLHIAPHPAFDDRIEFGCGGVVGQDAGGGHHAPHRGDDRVRVALHTRGLQNELVVGDDDARMHGKESVERHHPTHGQEPAYRFRAPAFDHEIGVERRVFDFDVLSAEHLEHAVPAGLPR